MKFIPFSILNPRINLFKFFVCLLIVFSSLILLSEWNQICNSLSTSVNQLEKNQKNKHHYVVVVERKQIRRLHDMKHMLFSEHLYYEKIN